MWLVLGESWQTAAAAKPPLKKLPVGDLRFWKFVATIDIEKLRADHTSEAWIAKGASMFKKLLPLAGLMFILASCGSSTTASSTTATSQAQANASQGIVSSVSSMNSKYGKILASSSGYAYYMFEPDTSQKSACYGACAVTWPPVTISGTATPPISGGINKSLVGTITRTGGARQITYNGHPLYTFKGDTGPGTTNGEGINHFGGYWYLVSISGKVVTSPASTKTTSSTGSGGAY